MKSHIIERRLCDHAAPANDRQSPIANPRSEIRFSRWLPCDPARGVIRSRPTSLPAAVTVGEGDETPPFGRAEREGLA